MHGEAKEWLDAVFFDRYLHVQSKWSHPWRLHATTVFFSTVLCDITATRLTEVCSNVIALNQLFNHSAEIECPISLRTPTRGCWNALQDAFFDVRVFYPNASSNRSSDPSAA